MQLIKVYNTELRRKFLRLFSVIILGFFTVSIFDFPAQAYAEIPLAKWGRVTETFQGSTLISFGPEFHPAAHKESKTCVSL